MSNSIKGLSQLQISPEKKSRRHSGQRLFVVFVILCVLAFAGILFAKRDSASGQKSVQDMPSVIDQTATPVPPKPSDTVLTVSGYVVPHERIEISPKFLGTVKTIKVRKGDHVKKGDVLVELEDDEYRARLMEAQGNVAVAEANLKNAEANLKRQRSLASDNVESNYGCPPSAPCRPRA